MKNNFNLDELDDFLSESAEQHRMYPSDKVWRNIDQELHGSKRWPALTFCAVLTVAVITAGLILIHPDRSLFTVKMPVSTANEKSVTTAASSKISSGESVKAEKINSSKGGSSNYVVATTPNSQKGSPAIPLSSLNNSNSYPEQTLTNAFINNTTEFLQVEPNDGNLGGSTVNSQVAGEEQKDEIVTRDTREEVVHSSLASNKVLRDDNRISLHLTTEKNSLLTISDPTPAVPDIALHETIKQSARASATKIASQKANTGKWNMLFYATPSISYRYLSEAKIVDLHQQNGPLAPNFTHGVNNFVRHKPMPGYEIGAAIFHNITPSVRLRVGLQANIRGYSIEAYASKREPSTIVLNRGFYTDSLVSISSISTQEGYKTIQITNRYFEVGVPIALDLRMANWKKLQVYVAAGLQPTYQFNKSMYMISDDYKNYIQDPNLVRHFNINTSIEAFMSYKAGGVTWQVGPQIRYQLLPGATNQYPVRERLIDYGFKIGVVKTLH